MLSITQPWPNIQESAVYVHQAKWHTFDSVFSLSTTTPSQLYIFFNCFLDYLNSVRLNLCVCVCVCVDLFYLLGKCLGRQVSSLSLVCACSSWREKNPHEKDLSQSDYIFVCLFVTQLLVLIASLFVWMLMWCSVYSYFGVHWLETYLDLKWCNDWCCFSVGITFAFIFVWW